MKYVTAYGIAVVIFLIIDAIWLGIVARGFYASRMGELMLDHPRWGVAAVFYLAYVGGLVYFAISVGMAQDSVLAAALNGALFGFFCYLTYDATNLAVLKGYDPVVAVVDVVWGTVLSATVAAGTLFAMKAFGLLPQPSAG
ncbi:DUF2177 family protein [Aquibium sp. ELW1220]|jgi:uncharacterized membrane protein|uniref:DUF2177 family protein n=1 Tax=Aquibium sp. ELW1220 TaxID=2976766 RepID=UPI0025AEE999|nr:DUF2177 family protein [Aquibium sp. ELW1220]MDN2580280.1 DUF2177 family protein [Aquibium sp. ELW1220]